MHMNNATRELACSFGTDSQLTGVYTPAVVEQSDKPCLVYLTAGLLHHVGPSRLHVELARTLAQDKFCSFRFDLSGVGESETSSLGGYFTERSVSEVQQAMDYLKDTYGHRRFVLVGLCSGADDALATAVRDQRVAGLLLLNGYAYKAGYFLLFRVMKFYIPRLFIMDKLINRLQRVWQQLRGGESSLSAAETSAVQQLDSDYRYVPPKKQTQALVKQLVREKTDMMLVYTGSEHDDYTYAGQLYAMYPSLRNSPYVHEYYAQMADHTFIVESDRAALIAHVRSWCATAAFDRSACFTEPDNADMPRLTPVEDETSPAA